MNRNDASAGVDEQRPIVIDANGGPTPAGEGDRLADRDTGALVLVVTPAIGVGRHALQEEGGPQGGDRPDAHVVMWREGETNYFCCGDLDPNELGQLTDEVRLATQRPPTAALFAMLTGTSSRP